MKRYINSAIAYMILGLASGVFFREFTKFNGFAGITALSYMHVHYVALGSVFFLMLLLMEKCFSFTQSNTRKVLIAYHVGLNIMEIGFLARGIFQVWGMELSKMADASISGIAGIGHVLLGVSLVLLLINMRKKIDCEAAS
jgi:hypothetical protein